MTAGASSPPGKRLIAFSALTDSALPGRNEDVSFFWACSNLPAWLAKPAYTTSVTKKTTHLAVRPAGTVKSFITPSPRVGPAGRAEPGRGGGARRRRSR